VIKRGGRPMRLTAPYLFHLTSGLPRASFRGLGGGTAPRPHRMGRSGAGGPSGCVIFVEGCPVLPTDPNQRMDGLATGCRRAQSSRQGRATILRGFQMGRRTFSFKHLGLDASATALPTALPTEVEDLAPVLGPSSPDRFKPFGNAHFMQVEMMRCPRPMPRTTCRYDRLSVAMHDRDEPPT
jgi:hypothetical protein